MIISLVATDLIWMFVPTQLGLKSYPKVAIAQTSSGSLSDFFDFELPIIELPGGVSITQTEPPGSTDYSFVDKSTGKYNYSHSLASLSSGSLNYSAIADISQIGHYYKTAIWNTEMPPSVLSNWNLNAGAARVEMVGTPAGRTWDPVYQLNRGGAVTRFIWQSTDATTQVKTYTTANLSNWIIEYYPASTGWDYNSPSDSEYPDYWKVIYDNGYVDHFNAYNPDDTGRGFTPVQSYENPIDMTGALAVAETSINEVVPDQTSPQIHFSNNYPWANTVQWGNWDGPFGGTPGQRQLVTSWGQTTRTAANGQQMTFTWVNDDMPLGAQFDTTNDPVALNYTNTSYVVQVTMDTGDSIGFFYETKDAEQFVDPKQADAEPDGWKEHYQTQELAQVVTAINQNADATFATFLTTDMMPVSKVYVLRGWKHDNDPPYYDTGTAEDTLNLFKPIITGFSHVRISDDGEEAEELAAPSETYTYSKGDTVVQTNFQKLNDGTDYAMALSKIRRAGGTTYSLEYELQDTNVYLNSPEYSATQTSEDGNTLPNANRDNKFGPGYNIMAGTGTSTADGTTEITKFALQTFGANGHRIPFTLESSTAAWNLYETYTGVPEGDPIAWGKETTMPKTADLISTENNWAFVNVPVADPTDAGRGCTVPYIFYKKRGAIGEETWQSAALEIPNNQTEMCMSDLTVYMYSPGDDEDGGTRSVPYPQYPVVDTSENAAIVAWGGNYAVYDFHDVSSLSYTLFNGTYSGDSDMPVGVQMERGFGQVMSINLDVDENGDVNKDYAMVRNKIFIKTEEGFKSADDALDEISNDFQIRNALYQYDAHAYNFRLKSSPRSFAKLSNEAVMQMLVGYNYLYNTKSEGDDYPAHDSDNSNIAQMIFRTDFVGTDYPQVSTDLQTTAIYTSGIGDPGATVDIGTHPHNAGNEYLVMSSAAYTPSAILFPVILSGAITHSVTHEEQDHWGWSCNAHIIDQQSTFEPSWNSQSDTGTTSSTVLSLETCLAGSAESSSNKNSFSTASDNSTFVTLNNGEEYEYYHFSTMTADATSNRPGQIILSTPGFTDDYVLPNETIPKWVKTLQLVETYVGLATMVPMMFDPMGIAFTLFSVGEMALNAKAQNAYHIHNGDFASYGASSKFFANGISLRVRNTDESVAAVQQGSDTYLPADQGVTDQFRADFWKSLFYAACDDPNTDSTCPSASSSTTRTLYLTRLENGDMQRNAEGGTTVLPITLMSDTVANIGDWRFSKIDNDDSDSCAKNDCSMMQYLTMSMGYVSDSSTSTYDSYDVYAHTGNSTAMWVHLQDQATGNFQDTVVSAVVKDDGVMQVRTEYDYSPGSFYFANDPMDNNTDFATGRGFIDPATGSGKFANTTVAFGMQNLASGGETVYYFYADSQDNLNNPLTNYYNDGSGQTVITDWMDTAGHRMLGKSYRVSQIRSSDLSEVATSATGLLVYDKAQTDAIGRNLISARGIATSSVETAKDDVSTQVSHSYNDRLYANQSQTTRTTFDPQPGLVETSTVIRKTYRSFASDVSDYNTANTGILTLTEQNRLREPYAVYVTATEDAGDEYLQKASVILYQAVERASDGNKIYMPYVTYNKLDNEEVANLSPLDGDGVWLPDTTDITSSDYVMGPEITDWDPVNLTAVATKTATGQTVVTQTAPSSYLRRISDVTFVNAELNSTDDLFSSSELTNGDFQINGDLGSTVSGINTAYFTSIDGWASLAGNFQIWEGAGGGASGVPEYPDDWDDNEDVVELDGNDTISQTITLSEPGYFRIGWWAAARNSGNRSEYRLVVNNVEQFVDNDPSASEWEEQSIEMVLPAGTNTITFEDQDAAGGCSYCGQGIHLNKVELKQYKNLGENLITHGDFEDVDLGTKTWSTFEEITGWQATNRVEIQKGVHGGVPSFPSGWSSDNQVTELDVAQPTAIDQNITIREDGIYRLRFDYAGRSSSAYSEFMVTMDNTAAYIENAANTSSWTEDATVYLSLTAGDHSLVFTSTDTNHNSIGAVIDNIELRQVLETTTNALHAGYEDYENIEADNCSGMGLEYNSGASVTGTSTYTGRKACGGSGLTMTVSDTFAGASGAANRLTMWLNPANGETCTVGTGSNTTTVSGDGSSWNLAALTLDENTDLSGEQILSCSGSGTSYVDNVTLASVYAKPVVNVFDTDNIFMHLVVLADNQLTSNQLYDEYRKPYATLVRNPDETDGSFMLGAMSIEPGNTLWNGYARAATAGITSPAWSASNAFNDDQDLDEANPNSALGLFSRNTKLDYYVSSPTNDITVDYSSVFVRTRILGDGTGTSESSIEFTMNSLVNSLTIEEVSGVYQLTWETSGGTPVISDSIPGQPEDLIIANYGNTVFVWADSKLVLSHDESSSELDDTATTTTVSFVENGDFTFNEILVGGQPAIRQFYLDGNRRTSEVHEMFNRLDSTGNVYWNDMVQRYYRDGYGKMAVSTGVVTYSNFGDDVYNPSGQGLLAYRYGSTDGSNYYQHSAVDWNPANDGPLLLAEVNEADGNTYTSDAVTWNLTGPGSSIAPTTSDAYYYLTSSTATTSPLSRPETVTPLPGEEFSSAGAFDLVESFSYQSDEQLFLENTSLSGYQSEFNYQTASTQFADGSQLFVQGARDTFGAPILSRILNIDQGTSVANEVYSGGYYSFNYYNNGVTQPLYTQHKQFVYFNEANVNFITTRNKMDLESQMNYASGPDYGNTWSWKDDDGKNRFISNDPGFNSEFTAPGIDMRMVYIKHDDQARIEEVGKMPSFDHGAGTIRLYARASNLDSTILADGSTCKTSGFEYDGYDDSYSNVTIPDAQLKNAWGRMTMATSYTNPIADIPQNTDSTASDYCLNSDQENELQVIKIGAYDILLRTTDQYSVFDDPSNSSTEIYKLSYDFGDSTQVQSKSYPTDDQGNNGGDDATIYYKYLPDGSMYQICDDSSCSDPLWQVSDIDVKSRLIGSQTGDGYDRSTSYDFYDQLISISHQDGSSDLLTINMTRYNIDTTDVCYSDTRVYSEDSLTGRQMTGSLTDGTENWDCYKENGQQFLTDITTLNTSSVLQDAESLDYDANGNLSSHTRKGQSSADTFSRESNSNKMSAISYEGVSFTPVVGYLDPYGAIEELTTLNGLYSSITRDTYGDKIIDLTVTDVSTGSVQSPDSLSYKYDVSGKRAYRELTTDSPTTSTTQWIYGGGLQPITENADGEYVLSINTPDGQKIKRFLGNTNGVEDWYLKTDQLGNVMGIYGRYPDTSTGNFSTALVASIQYATLGMPTATLSLGYGGTSPATILQSYVTERFQSQRYDYETDLHHFPAREYDASTGRFLSMDPAGLGQ